MSDRRAFKVADDVTGNGLVPVLATASYVSVWRAALIQAS